MSQVNEVTATLTFLKNYLKDIEQICEENSSKFE